MSKAFGMMLVGLALVGVAGCESDDGNTGGDTNAKKLTGEAKVTPLAGKAPLKASFEYVPKTSDGDVKVKWTFGDGTTSTAKSGTHEFKKPDFYAINATATDAGGHEESWSMLARAYDPKKVKTLAQLEKDPRGAQVAVNDQIKQTVIDYYTKYPAALPSNPKSDFYKTTYPYLLPLYEKHKALILKRARLQGELTKQQLKQLEEDK